MNTATIYRSPRAGERVAAVADWLRALAPGAEALVVAPNWDAADDLLREYQRLGFEPAKSAPGFKVVGHRRHYPDLSAHP